MAYGNLRHSMQQNESLIRDIVSCTFSLQTVKKFNQTGNESSSLFFTRNNGNCQNLGMENFVSAIMLEKLHQPISSKLQISSDRVEFLVRQENLFFI